VQDCYDLIAEYMRAFSNVDQFGVVPRIYVATPTPTGYGALTGKSDLPEVGPDAIARSGAELVR
jgi:hypothetical protein